MIRPPYPGRRAGPEHLSPVNRSPSLTLYLSSGRMKYTTLTMAPEAWINEEGMKRLGLSRACDFVGWAPRSSAVKPSTSGFGAALVHSNSERAPYTFQTAFLP